MRYVEICIEVSRYPVDPGALRDASRCSERGKRGHLFWASKQRKRWDWHLTRKYLCTVTTMCDSVLIHIIIYLSIYRSIYLSIHPSIHPSIYLYIYISYIIIYIVVYIIHLLVEVAQSLKSHLSGSPPRGTTSLGGRTRWRNQVQYVVNI